MRGAWAKPKHLIQTPYTWGEYDVTNTFVRNSMYCVLRYVYCPYFWEALYYGPHDCKLSLKRSTPSLGPGYYGGIFHQKK